MFETACVPHAGFPLRRAGCPFLLRMRPCFLTPGASRFWGVIQKHLSGTASGTIFQERHSGPSSGPGDAVPECLKLPVRGRKKRQAGGACLPVGCRSRKDRFQGLIARTGRDDRATLAHPHSEHPHSDLGRSSCRRPECGSGLRNQGASD